MTKLCEALESSRYAFGKDVFVDGFTYFNAQERQVLESILRQARSVTVTLLGEPDSAEEMFQVSLRTRDQLTRLADQAGCPWEVRTLTSADDSAWDIWSITSSERGSPTKETAPPSGSGSGHRFFRGGADGSGHPPPGSGGEVPLPGYHRGRPEHDRLRGHH